MARVLRCFDAAGRLQRWPARRADQILALWVIWSLLPHRRFDEAEITATLASWNDYGDPALLRRELCDLDLLRRTPDGRVYLRIAREPPPEAAALILRFEG